MKSYSTLFSFDPASNFIATQMDFSETTGRSPYGKLTKATDNKLYGMTSRGGINDKGVLFSFEPNTSTTPFKKLVDFNGTNGINPSASMVELKEYVVLPLTLVSFNAIEENEKINLDWQVDAEYDLDKYEIERSTDGIRFTTIGFVPAINSPTAHAYGFTDHKPSAGMNYYRLKIHEKSATPHFSQIKVVNMGIAAFKAAVHPNPVRSTSTIQVRLVEKTKVQMQLFNVQGMLVKQWPSVIYDKGDQFIPLVLTNIATGNYVLLVDAGISKQFIQIIKVSAE